MRLLVLNGPNLDLLGTREPAVYGPTTLDDLNTMVTEWGRGMGVQVETRQSNSEAEIIDLIHRFDGDGIVINPGAFTHTSRAIADAIRGVGPDAVEVHISNIKAREPWRATSVISEACVGTIFGRGPAGYRDGMRHLVNRATMPFDEIRYGPHHDNVGDLRRGEGDDLVVLVHGGIWRLEYERDTTESLATDLTRRGFHTWNIEYRRRGGGGGWPASGHDVLTAFDHVHHLEHRPRRVIVVGHSAGSHLAMWAASRSTTPIDLHVALGPLLDLAGSVEAADACAGDCREMIDEGCPPMSEPGEVPTVLVHGDTDQIVPVERSIEFAARHGLEHHRTGCDHFSLLDPTKAEWDWAVQRMGPAA
jgi:3-dehydroquinate dehydratase-2